MSASIYECRAHRNSTWRVCDLSDCEAERRISPDRVLTFLEEIKHKLDSGEQLTEQEQATLSAASDYIAGLVREFLSVLQEHLVPAFQEFAKNIQALWDSLPEELRVQLATPARPRVDLAAAVGNPYRDPGLPLGYITRFDPYTDRNLS